MINKIPLILIPATKNTDLYSTALYLQNILKKDGINAAIFMPISEDNQPEAAFNKIEDLLYQNKLAELLENIVLNYKAETNKQNTDLTIVCGIDLSCDRPYIADLNRAISEALDAKIIFVASYENADKQVKIIENIYQRNMPNRKALGTITHKVLESISFADSEKISESIKSILADTHKQRITPPIFCTELIKRAQNAKKRIVLPEGDELRTLKAAEIATSRGIAECILLGESEKINAAAQSLGVSLNGITVIDAKAIYSRYIDRLVEMRQSKGMTKEKAVLALQDTVMIGTMMLKLNEVDGLISGAVHTTANTVRPALQIIKTIPENKIVSSVFFMCSPEQVLLYSDCAINPEPTSEDLAAIAIQSANSACAFGLPARIAMLSYSTGQSGTGKYVDKIKQATELVKQRRPDLEIEGPIQYDAAVDQIVAKLKLPQSTIAGRATVFIFPDLNSGNITCKAVQRSTNIICIGPMLQGLNKPVNDLSRGCSVEDIVFTIALTAVQATGNNY